MYRPTDLRISGASTRHSITASSTNAVIPDMSSPAEAAKRVAVSIEGPDEAFFSFTNGAGTATLAGSHHQSQEDGMQVYWVGGNSFFNVIGLTTGSKFCITPLDN